MKIDSYFQFKSYSPSLSVLLFGLFLVFLQGPLLHHSCQIPRGGIWNSDFNTSENHFQSYSFQWLPYKTVLKMLYVERIWHVNNA